MADNSPSFADQVNDAVGRMTQGTDGKWQLPDDVKDNEALSFAVNSERRRRDTQSAYTQAQQKLKRTEVERDQFAHGWEEDFARKLPVEDQATLEELKATDPEAWRAKLNELEQNQRKAFKERATEIQQKASTETEAEYRNRALQQFQEANPDLVVNDDVIANDIPPRVLKELENGSVDFGTFLNNVKTYLTKGKVMTPGATKTTEPNLSEQPGGSHVDDEAARQANIKSYDQEIF